MTKSEKSYWINSGLLSLLEKVSVQMFGFGTFALLYRNLSESNAGIWVLFMSVTALIEMGKAGLVQNGMIRFISTEDEVEHSKIFNAASVLNILVTLVSSVFLLILSHFLLGYFWDFPVLKILFQIYIITTIVLIPFQQFNFLQQANLDFKGTFWSTFAKQGAFFIFVLGYFIFGESIPLINLALFQIFTAFLASFVAYRFGRKYFVKSDIVDWNWVKKLFQYGKFVFGTNLSAMLYKSIDKWMLGALAVPMAVAHYDACIKVANLVEVPAFSVASIVFPQNARKSAKEGKGAVKLMYEKAVGAILTVTLPAVLFVWAFPSWILWIIAGDKYVTSAPLLALTILYGFFIPFSNQFGTILDSIGKPHINFRFVIIGALINIVSNYFFITKYGIYGAAYGTILTYTIMFFANHIVLYRMFEINPLKPFYYAIEFYGKFLKFIQDKWSSKFSQIHIKTP